MSKDKFGTGAVRSNDADSVDFYLISPIGLEMLAVICSDNFHELYRNLTPAHHIGKAIGECYTFLSGNRDKPWLPRALWHNLTAIDRLNNHTIDIPFTKDKNKQYEQIPPFGLRSIAKAYNEGRHKYGAYNCEKGFPVYDLLNHALNHYNLFLSNDTTEDHLGHAGWNVLMSIHSYMLWPHLNKDNLRGVDCSPPLKGNNDSK